MNLTTRKPNSQNVVTFQELEFQLHPMGMGKQCIVQYSNGYGASIVQGPHTYGGKDDL